MKKNRGFTLVELIIVIAVIAVLTAVLVPSYFKYVAQSRERVCLNNLDTVERACLINTIFVEPAPSEASARQIMADTLAEMHETADAEGHYDGLCPGKGSVTIEYDADAAHVYLKCSEHGELGADASFDTAFMKALLQIKNDGTNQYSAWTSYWTPSRLAGGSSIDSGSTDNGGGAGSSFAAQIKGYFETLGVDAGTRSWRVYRKETATSTTFDVFLADVNIDSLALNTVVNVTKYDFTTDPPTVTTGTAPLTTAGNGTQTYTVIKGSDFRAAN